MPTVDNAAGLSVFNATVLEGTSHGTHNGGAQSVTKDSHTGACYSVGEVYIPPYGSPITMMNEPDYI